MNNDRKQNILNLMSENVEKYGWIKNQDSMELKEIDVETVERGLEVGFHLIYFFIFRFRSVSAPYWLHAG